MDGTAEGSVEERESITINLPANHLIEKRGKGGRRDTRPWKLVKEGTIAIEQTLESYKREYLTHSLNLYLTGEANKGVLMFVFIVADRSSPL